MPVHAVFTYDITDPERYAKYNPGSMDIVGGTIAKHGGEVVFAGPANYAEGTAKMANVCLCFPTMSAFESWMSDPQYAAIKGHREEATNNYTIFFVES